MDVNEKARRLIEDAKPSCLMDRSWILNRTIVNLNEHEGETVLHLATKLDRADLVSILLDHKADVNACDRYGYRPLHFARSAVVARLLLDNGACVEATTNEFGDSSGETALHKNSRSGCVEVVQVLLQYGAYINEQNNFWGFTALHLATRGDHAKVVSVLLEYKADVDSCNRYYDRPLHLAQSAKIAELLLENGAYANAKNERFIGYWQTPLHVASQSGCEGVVSVLLRYGADINARDNFGASALHHAKSDKIIKLLFAAGADANAKDNLGRTALHWFAEYNPSSEEDVALALIQSGCDINLRADSGHTALSLAYERERYNNAKALLAIISLKVSGCKINLKEVRLPEEEEDDHDDDELQESSINLAEFITLCQNELHQLKIHKLTGTCLSLYDILYTSNARYVSNKPIVDTLNSVQFNKYPVYGRLIASKIESDKSRLGLLQTAEKFFKISGSIFSGLPEVMKFKILEYLDNTELENITKYACSGTT